MNLYHSLNRYFLEVQLFKTFRPLDRRQIKENIKKISSVTNNLETVWKKWKNDTIFEKAYICDKVWFEVWLFFKVFCRVFPFLYLSYGIHHQGRWKKLQNRAYMLVFMASMVEGESPCLRIQKPRVQIKYKEIDLWCLQLIIKIYNKFAFQSEI